MLSTGKHILIACSFISLVIVGCSKERSSEEGDLRGSGEITMNFQSSVRTLDLNFDDEYTTDLGETYHVSKFSYYIHHVELVNKEGTAIVPLPGYLLLDESVPSSRTITFRVPADDYRFINFTLGVDSADNMSGAQAGALDPTNGMFWTWTSGYVMAKLEGSSPYVTGPTNNFSFHIGGYKSPYAVMKHIKLPVSASGLVLAKDSSLTVTINADINTWFSRLNLIEMALTPACHSPGELAKKIADNYEGMFSLSNIE